MENPNPIRREFITWKDVDKLIDHIIPQLNEEYQAILTVTRGGVIPGGILAEALDVKSVLTAAVDFPDTSDIPEAKLLAWPNFLQFPSADLLAGRHVLIVDDVWGSGRTTTAVREMVMSSGGSPYVCVLHFNPYRNLFKKVRPDYYGAVTDAFIVYPWEVRRSDDFSPSMSPSPTNN